MSDNPSATVEFSPSLWDYCPSFCASLNVNLHREYSTPTAVDQLHSVLRSAIISGEIKAGSRLNEQDLTRQYGVSRSTARAAISRLEAGDLVTRKANSSARVAPLTVAELLEIYHIREALEGMACRLAAQNMTDDEIIELQQLLEQQLQSSELQEGKAYYQKEGDLDFHFRLVQGSKNRKLIHLLCDELYDKARMYRYQFGMASPRALDAYAEHKHIVKAIADRDGEMAEMLIRRHIRASRLNIEKQLNT